MSKTAPSTPRPPIFTAVLGERQLSHDVSERQSTRLHQRKRQPVGQSKRELSTAYRKRLLQQPLHPSLQAYHPSPMFCPPSLALPGRLHRTTPLHLSHVPHLRHMCRGTACMAPCYDFEDHAVGNPLHNEVEVQHFRESLATSAWAAVLTLFSTTSGGG